MKDDKKIWTIGHSNRTLIQFIEILQSFEIKILADIRSFPGSKFLPHFNKENLKISLEEIGIEYIHLVDLGGRRKTSRDSVNTGWKNDAFRGYADYMQTQAFQTALVHLEEFAAETNLAYMCAEAVWWSCHRSLVSDSLKFIGWHVYHITEPGRATEHPYTAPARIENGKLTYPPAADLLF